jgi:hypothetical protein
VILLRFIFIAQLIVMLPVFALLLVTPANLGTVGIYLFLVPAGVVISLIALWRFIRHPAERRLAAATIATPVICLGVPVAVYSLHDGPVAPVVLVVAVLVLLVIAALALLGKTDQFRGTGLFANRRFNVSCLVALCVLLLMLWLPVITVLAGQHLDALPTAMAERDRIIAAAKLYLMAVAIPAACLSLFTLLYAPVGLVRNRGRRLIHLGQLLSALLLLATVAWIAMVVFILMVNPG